MESNDLNQEATSSRRWNWGRIKLFFALSRAPHGLIDMASPALAALLSLGSFPSFGVTLLGLFTAFAGYTAVYALNDLIGYRSDREKVKSADAVPKTSDLDALLVRHPLAQGFLSFKEGFLWTFAWGTVALLGAWVLNPVCLAIFFAACLLEILYCLLWRITPYRAIINGLVKTAGPLAAVFAVNPDPSFIFLALVFLLIFFWEIGGQNIPNDWTDVEEDRRFQAKTVPICFGSKRSSHMILGSLTAAILLSMLLFAACPADFVPLFYLIIGVLGGILLIWPAMRLSKSLQDKNAMLLFNLASYYPFSLLIVAVVNLVI